MLLHYNNRQVLLVRVSDKVRKNLLIDKLQQATSSAYQAATREALQYQQKLNEQVATQAANIEGALYQKGKKYGRIY